jgi:hypothetical protein
MSKKLSILSLAFVIFAMQGCNSAASYGARTAIQSETPPPKKESVASLQKVEFRGVSFTYDPQIFAEVRTQEIAETPLMDATEKPDNVAPQHLLFKLKSSKVDREAAIYIFPIDDYRRMYSISKGYTEQFDEDLKDLQKVLENKNYRQENQIPFIPLWDSSQSFQQKVKHASFKNGKGIFFLTQFDIEPSLVNNEGLTYVFEGITDDRKKYILAEFPAGVSFLPRDFSVIEFDGYELPEYFYADKSNEKRYNEYRAKIVKRLEALKPNEFEPNLNSLEEIISSLKIEK